MDILLKMASRLTIPFDYNVEFQATSSHRKGRRSLYIHRSAGPNSMTQAYPSFDIPNSSVSVQFPGGGYQRSRR